jgi:hypothetical protein
MAWEREDFGVGLSLKGQDEFCLFLGFGGGCYDHHSHRGVAPAGALLGLNFSLLVRPAAGAAVVAGLPPLQARVATVVPTYF